MNIELSVVVPIYRCAGCLEVLYERLVAALSPLTNSFELVLVNDASPDDAWPRMLALAERDERVVALSLSRNFGQHAAITAGLTEARGRFAVVMDGDLQDPPEDVPRLYAKALEGYEVVFAKRKRKQHSLYRQVMANTYNWLLNRFSPFPIDPEYGSFSLIARPVIDAFVRIRTHGQHYVYMLHWLGFRATHIEYGHAERGDGNTSSYTLWHLIRFALSGLFMQTTRLLSWIVYVGFAFSLCGFVGALWIVYLYFTRSIQPGWSSLVVLTLGVGGLLIISLGIVALYIGQIFEQVQGRPSFVVARRAGQVTAAQTPV